MTLTARIKLFVGIMPLLTLPAVGLAATKDRKPPDHEMLKMIEFLRQMDMIKQMDMLREMQHLEDGAAPAAPAPKAPTRKPETSK